MRSIRFALLAAALVVLLAGAVAWFLIDEQEPRVKRPSPPTSTTSTTVTTQPAPTVIVVPHPEPTTPTTQPPQPCGLLDLECQLNQ